MDWSVQDLAQQTQGPFPRLVLGSGYAYKSSKKRALLQNIGKAGGEELKNTRPSILLDWFRLEATLLPSKMGSTLYASRLLPIAFDFGVDQLPDPNQCPD